MSTLSNILGIKNKGINGTGNRAYYAMLSYNTSQNTGGIVYYDENFMPVLASGYAGAINAVNAGIQYMGNDSMLYMASTFYNVASTSGYTSSSATSNYMNATNASSALGNCMIDVFNDGTYMDNRCRNGSWNCKFFLGKYMIDSTHSNKRIAYLLIGNTFRAIDLLFGTSGYDLVNTNAIALANINPNMVGSASYNLSRKELVIISFSGSGGSFNVITYQNLDLDKYPNPAIAFARPEVVVVNSTVSLSSSWAINDNESYYNLKPILCNDGQIFVSVMFTSNKLALYKFTRNGTSAITATYIAGVVTSTTYSYATDVYYGQKSMTSRDGNSVITFCPYYYYGSGIAALMFNRINSTYYSYSATDSSYGYNVVPYKDNGWAFYYCGNGYASNYNGSYIAARYLLDTAANASTFVNLGTKFFNIFPYPNTTNYPAFTQVTDYNLLDSNTWGAK